jgi:hypothetical protein
MLILSSKLASPNGACRDEVTKNTSAQLHKVAPPSEGGTHVTTLIIAVHSPAVNTNFKALA